MATCGRGTRCTRPRASQCTPSPTQCSMQRSPHAASSGTSSGGRSRSPSRSTRCTATRPRSSTSRSTSPTSSSSRSTPTPSCECGTYDVSPSCRSGVHADPYQTPAICTTPHSREAGRALASPPWLRETSTLALTLALALVPAFALALAHTLALALTLALTLTRVQVIEPSEGHPIHAMLRDPLTHTLILADTYPQPHPSVFAALAKGKPPPPSPTPQSPTPHPSPSPHSPAPHSPERREMTSAEIPSRSIGKERPIVSAVRPRAVSIRVPPKRGRSCPACHLQGRLEPVLLMPP